MKWRLVSVKCAFSGGEEIRKMIIGKRIRESARWMFGMRFLFRLNPQSQRGLLGIRLHPIAFLDCALGFLYIRYVNQCERITPCILLYFNAGRTVISEIGHQFLFMPLMGKIADFDFHDDFLPLMMNTFRRCSHIMISHIFSASEKCFEMDLPEASR